jgi:hypothetical protein
VGTQQSAEGIGLGIAQRREFSCHMAYRAVMLADLNARPDRIVDYRCCVAITRECRDKLGHSLRQSLGLADCRITTLEFGDPVVGERHDRFRTTGVAQETKSTYG